jgi:D-threonate/D-erythronate kinase
MRVTIVADDLTGACDTGASFAGKAPVAVTVWPHPPARADVRVVDTESRSTTPAEAVARVAASAAAAPGTRYFKKIDSTLRGHVAREVEALMRVIGASAAVVCPAFPAQGRIVRHRTLLVDGVPVAETAVGRDPDFPRAAGGRTTVVDLLRPHLEQPVAWVPLADVRASLDALAVRLTRLDGMVAVADAETDADLERLVDAALSLDRPPLLVGAAALGRALAAALGLLSGPVTLPPGRRWLLVAGSRQPATRCQVLAARAAGLRVLATPEAEAADPAAAARGLAAEACRLLARETFDLVAVTGGQTAVALYEALGAEGPELLGAPRPGLALGVLRAPRQPGLAVLTKAGGFGPADLFVTLAAEAAA